MLNGIILSYPTFQYIRSTFSVFKLALRKAKDKHGSGVNPSPSTVGNALHSHPHLIFTEQRAKCHLAQRGVNFPL